MSTMVTVMKKSQRRLSRVVDSSASPLLRQKGMLPASEVPVGHVPLHVGDQDEAVERFVVRAELLSRPALVDLLRRSAQEYGYGQRGVLRIPCPVAVFQKVLDSLGGGGSVVYDYDADVDADAAAANHKIEVDLCLS